MTKSLTQLLMLLIFCSTLLLSCTKDKDKEESEDQQDLAQILVKDDGSLNPNYNWWTVMEAGLSYYSASGSLDSTKEIGPIRYDTQVQFGSKAKANTGEIFASFMLSSLIDTKALEDILPTWAAWKITNKNVFTLYMIDAIRQFKTEEELKNIKGLGDWKLSYNGLQMLFEKETDLPGGRKLKTHFILL